MKQTRKYNAKVEKYIKMGIKDYEDYRAQLVTT